MNSSRLLELSTQFWFILTLIGQWVFALYILMYPVYLIIKKGLQGMADTHMPNGYIEGDNLGNGILGLHLVIAIIIIGGGPLQLIPQIRTNFPGFHRWLGRAYLTSVVIAAIGGFYLIWTRPRPSFGSIFQEMAISLEAVLIIVFALLTYKHALNRSIRVHRKWAIRLFLVASGVWFLRIGYMGWYFIEEIIGFKFEHFFEYWSFGSYLVPLGTYELYLQTTKRKTAGLNMAMAIVLFLFSCMMGLGIFIATKSMWFPKILTQ